MDPDQWRRVEEILNGALDVSLRKRNSYVETSCKGDVPLLAAVQRLLTIEDTAGSFLEDPLSLQDDQALLDLIGAEPTPESTTLPNRIGRYEIVGLVGIGGMGTVFEAWDGRLNRRVAIKILNDSAVPEDRLARLRREARILARLDHPCLVKIFEIIDTNGSAALVMEFADGTPLSDLIDTTELTYEQVISYSTQLAGGLRAAHEAKVVHRDLKAENVKISDAGAVRILDFGVAKIDPEALPDDEESISGVGLIVGSAIALAPERVRGEIAGPASDLFALGTLMYQMLTGEHPFANASLITTMRRINRHTPPQIRERRQDVPKALEQIVADLLEKEVDQRIESAADLESRLLPLSDRASSAAAPAQQHIRSGRDSWLLRICLLTILAGLLIIILS